MPLYNNLSTHYLDNSLKQSAITYAALRGLNGAVSIIQHSSIGVGAGVSADIALGEALDPINDAIERFSDLITISIWMFGGQKILYEVSKTPLVLWILALLCLLSLFDSSKITQKILVVLILFRLFIPFSALFSNYLDQEIFQPKIDKNLAILASKPTQLDSQIITPDDQNASFWQSVKEQYNATTHSVSKLQESASYYIKNAEEIVGTLLQLAILSFTKFVIDILLLPLLLFYIVKNIKLA
jgi:hypothetical protein